MRIWIKLAAAAAVVSAWTGTGHAQSQRRAATAEASLPPGLRGLGQVVGNARTVVFGEDSHGMYEVHRLILPMFRYLVETKGFRVFVFEAQWANAAGLADFMASNRTTLGPVESYWLNGAFASQPIADLLVWIRNWNRAHPNDQIQIAGYQPEQPVTDFQELFTHLNAIAIQDVARLRTAVAPCRAADGNFSNELAFLTANGRRRRQDRLPIYTDADRAACLTGLTEIEQVLQRLEGSDQSVAAERARLHLHSLKTYVGLLTSVQDRGFSNPDMPVPEQTALQGEAYGNGDAARFRIYQSLQRMNFPRAKVFHWMHNWHAARHASRLGAAVPGGLTIPTGTVSIGERIAGAEAPGVVTILNLVPCGTTCREPANSLEPAFASAFGERTQLVDLRRGAQVRGLPVATPGVIFANHHDGGFGNVVLRDQADAVLYIPRTETTRGR